MTLDDFVLESRNAYKYMAYAECNGALRPVGQVKDFFDEHPDWHDYDIAVNDENGYITFLVPLSVLDGCDHEE